MLHLAHLIACTPPSFEASFVASQALDTVGIVSWTTDEPGESWVEFGPDPAYGFRTRSEATVGRDHDVVIAGLPAGSSWHWRAVSTVDGEDEVSADAVVETSPAPFELAVLSSTVAEATPMGWVLGGILQSDQAHVVMFDAAGRYAWWRAVEADHTTGGARPTRDGTGVYYASYPSDRTLGTATLTYSSWDQSVVDTWPLDGGHHDLTELPGGVVGYIRMDVREVEGVSVVGDAIWEFDVTTGEHREVWNAWNFLGDPDPATIDDTGFYVQGIDWTHVNTLDYVQERDAYLVSSRNLGRIWLIERATGEVQWSLGEGQDFSLGSGTWFEKQHSPELTDGGILVFDNTRTGQWSRVVEYSLDEATMTAEQVWEYKGNDDTWALMMGDVHRFDDGSTLANWGWGGSVTQLSAAREELWRVNLELGAAMTFADPVERPGGAVP